MEMMPIVKIRVIIKNAGNADVMKKQVNAIKKYQKLVVIVVIINPLPKHVAKAQRVVNV